MSLEALGRSIVEIVAKQIGESTGQALVGALVERFGVSWLQGQVDWFQTNLAIADERAREKFDKK